VQHLANNSIDLNTNKITFGPKLRFDPSNEKFIGSGSEQANALLKNNYRGEWMIPEIV
jgi:hypothetical protein